MTNITDHERLDRLDNMLWKKCKVDVKGRTVLPAKLRKYIGLREKSKILWIQVQRKHGRDNEFLLEIGVDNK